MTLEEARALADEGRLAEKLMPPDYPLGHLPRADAPAKMRKLAANGAKLPLLPGTETVAEGKPIRIYLDEQFYGLVERSGDVLRWKVQIVPEAEEMNA